MNAQEIVFPISRFGIFDPSVADSPESGRAWMSYSAVDQSPLWREQCPIIATTRLAYSDNRESFWKDAGIELTQIKDVEIGSKKATWINEVSSLIYDAGAAPAERWQLYWHHYLLIGTERKLDHGWIGHKSAATPEGLSSANEVKLFAAMIYDENDDSPVAETRSPVNGAPLIALDKLHEDLKYCLAFTEPGAMVTPSGIYLALNCITPKHLNAAGMLETALFGATAMNTVLLKCEAPCRPDQPHAWRYSGVLLNPDDSQSFGYKLFSASNLYEEKGQAYLMVSPASDNPVPDAYNGCFVFRVADLEHGRLERDTNDRLVVVKKILGRENSFNGACTYRPSSSQSGYIYSQLDFNDNKPYFHIYQRGDGL